MTHRIATITLRKIKYSNKNICIGISVDLLVTSHNHVSNYLFVYR